MSKKSILLLGNLKIGSRFGLLPENFKNNNGNIIYPNQIQQEILSKFNKLYDKIKDSYDTLILLGGIVEGSNINESNNSLMSINEQIRAAKILLRPFTKNHDVIAIGDDIELDKKICRDLGGEFGGRIANLKIEDKIINIACSEFTSQKKQKEYILASLNSRLKVFQKANMIVRQSYFYSYMKNLEKHIVLNPGWSIIARYKQDIGATKIEISNNEIKVIPLLYHIK